MLIGLIFWDRIYTVIFFISQFTVIFCDTVCITGWKSLHWPSIAYLTQNIKRETIDWIIVIWSILVIETRGNGREEEEIGSRLGSDCALVVCVWACLGQSVDTWLCRAVRIAGPSVERRRGVGGGFRRRLLLSPVRPPQRSVFFLRPALAFASHLNWFFILIFLYVSF